MTDLEKLQAELAETSRRLALLTAEPHKIEWDAMFSVKWSPVDSNSAVSQPATPPEVTFDTFMVTGND